MFDIRYTQTISARIFQKRFTIRKSIERLQNQTSFEDSLTRRLQIMMSTFKCKKHMYRISIGKIDAIFVERLDGPEIVARFRSDKSENIRDDIKMLW